MPHLNVRAVQQLMVRRNILFKHQMANVLGISYARLIAIMTEGEQEVEVSLVERLCDVLNCDRAQIVCEATP